MIYQGRVFEEDHPPSFIFAVVKHPGYTPQNNVDNLDHAEVIDILSPGESPEQEQVAYFLEQLTHYEETGQLQYLGQHISSIARVIDP